MSDLQRFLEAQNFGDTYATALNEIKSGRKRSHWIWYIFPQLKGLGRSRRSEFYGIANLDEARDYLQHEILGKRLVEISNALLQLDENDAYTVMGSPDDMKLQSCMTLFAIISEDDSNASVFHRVLEKFFAGKMDNNTLELVKGNHERI